MIGIPVFYQFQQYLDDMRASDKGLLRKLYVVGLVLRFVLDRFMTAPNSTSNGSYV